MPKSALVFVKERAASQHQYKIKSWGYLVKNAFAEECILIGSENFQFDKL